MVLEEMNGMKWANLSRENENNCDVTGAWVSEAGVCE